MAISLRSKITRKLLNYFFIHDQDRFYIREIAGKIEELPSNTRIKLLELFKEGVLNSEFRGKERFFFLNTKYRFLKEYKEIVKKSFGIEAILKENLSKIKGIKKVILFGSYAQDKLTPTSDIDILVVGDYDYNELYKELTRLQYDLRIEVNPVEYSVQEYERKLKEKENFLMSVLKTKVINVI